MRYTTAGYGDACTWPPYSGHPNDPRRPEPLDEDSEPLLATCLECGACDWIDIDTGWQCAECGEVCDP